MASEAQRAFNNWTEAADAADSAEHQLRVALSAHLFISDPAAFRLICEQALELRLLADLQLDAAVAGLAGSICNGTGDEPHGGPPPLARRL